MQKATCPHLLPDPCRRGGTLIAEFLFDILQHGMRATGTRQVDAPQLALLVLLVLLKGAAQ
jgi:hypothetical protein